MENGNTKDDLRLPTDEQLLSQVSKLYIQAHIFVSLVNAIADATILCAMQIKDGFGDGKDLVVTVMSAMGEEQICALKDIGPK
jgi:translation initiation factor 5A